MSNGDGWLSWLQQMVDESSEQSTRFGPGYRKIASRIIENARIIPGDHVLDIGTGTGLLALAASRIVGSHGHILGIDVDIKLISEPRPR